MKSKLILTLFATMFSFQSAFGAWTYVPEANSKRDKAAQKAMALNKNVRVDHLISAVEPFFTSADIESLFKSVKDPRAKKVKLDRIVHGKDSFLIQSGDVKITYKWVNKNNVAFTLNGTPFTYEEASKTEVWQPKVHEVIKASVGKNDKVSVFSSTTTISGFGLLSILMHTEEADAFLTNPWVLGGIGVAAIGLIGLSFYNKHKDEHQKKFQNVQAKLASAKATLEARKKEFAEQGNTNPDLSAYENEVTKLENLAAEYGSAVEDVGFFGYLFGKRIKTPGEYNRQNLDYGVQ